MNSSSSVDIISKKDIEDTKINNIEDISSLISNVNISGVGNRSDRTFTFRGISNYVSYESSVAVYIDNIPIPFSYGYSAFNMNNIENIEVLKGPQGTLFGKNANAGVINIQTKPTSKVLLELFPIKVSFPSVPIRFSMLIKVSSVLSPFEAFPNNKFALTPSSPIALGSTL